MLLPDTLEFLVGEWDLRRSVRDHLAGVDASFVGTASFVVSEAASRSGPPHRARYSEAVEMVLGAHRGPASRELLYVRRDDSTVMVYFADGRPFVDLDLREGEWRSVHPCSEDFYETVTLVRSADSLEERWRVWGPTKSYEAVTSLTRLPPAS